MNARRGAKARNAKTRNVKARSVLASFALRVYDNLRGFVVQTTSRDADLQQLTPDLYRQINRATGEVRLPQGPVPGTLIVVGQREPAMSRRHVARIGGTVPGVVACVVRDVGHAWNLEAPDLFNATVWAWLAGDPLPTALTPLQHRVA